MANLVWLASYPKSGNTWLRALLTAYLAGTGVPVDINDIDASLHSASRTLFDRVVGFASADLAPAQIDELRADVYRAFDAEAEHPLFLKTHDIWRRTRQGRSLFPADATRQVVLIVRNPLAVAPSFAHHLTRSVDEAIDMMADPDTILSPQSTSLKTQLPQPLGTWSMHTVSWLDQPELPVHVVRYEDLRRDPQAGFAAVVRACGVEVDDALLADAIARTDFATLQRSEAATPFRERPAAATSFFRHGQVDRWRTELTAEQVARVVHEHGPVMDRLGYLPRP